MERTRIGSSRSHNRWTRQLTVLDGGASSHRRRFERTRRVTIDVVLAQPAGLVRAGLRSLLEGERDIRVVAEATTGEQAVARAAELRPDVVLIDLHLPGLGGIAATQRILGGSTPGDVRVVALTASECEEDLFGALQAGVSGFMPLDTEPAELARAVRVVARGGAQLSPFATARLLDELPAVADPRANYAAGEFEELTVRERDIVVLVAVGLSNCEIAERLVISPATVKTHVSRAMRKLRADTRAKLVALAHESGFVRRHRAVDARVSIEPSPIGWQSAKAS
jgi:DNA-binding NarL/FixJ family response regulator